MYKFHAKPNIVSAIYLKDSNIVRTDESTSPPTVTTVNKGDWLVVIKDSEGLDVLQGYTHEEFINTFTPDNADAKTFLDTILALLA